MSRFRASVTNLAQSRAAKMSNVVVGKDDVNQELFRGRAASDWQDSTMMERVHSSVRTTGRQCVPSSPYKPSTLLKKITVWQGDITTLKVDAIVNAANRSLLGGGGVDGAIHRAAGRSLYDECKTLGGCDTGKAKMTRGYNLPAKAILHTVGPQDGNEDMLKSCYASCLKIVAEERFESIAFCCIATGVYGYPNRDAAHVALKTVREWLDTDGNADKVKQIIFCVFLGVDYDIYNELLSYYFPVPTDNPGEGTHRFVCSQSREASYTPQTLQGSTDSAFEDSSSESNPQDLPEENQHKI